MSVLFKSSTNLLLDHCEYITNIYNCNLLDRLENTSYKLSPKIFSVIHKNNEAKSNRKRGSSGNILSEAMKVKQLFHEFAREIPEDVKASIEKNYKLLHTSDVRDLSKNLFESTVFDHCGINGGNNSNRHLKCKIKEDYFLIPANSRFFCGCVKEQCLKLDGNKFDIVIADPPWWNKYIRRLKRANDKLGYSMMYNEDIAAIPINNLLTTNCLIAFWCTNAQSNINAVTDIIFPKWGVQYVATWYWLKVTVDLEPLCDFGTGCKKQPYERLILGKVGDVMDVPDQLIVSVPSALHSHKPPLLDLLSPFIKVDNPQILELFARYLLPNTTSVGYEPLKWQHISLYETVT